MGNLINKMLMQRHGKAARHKGNQVEAFAIRFRRTEHMKTQGFPCVFFFLQSTAVFS